MHCRQGRDFHAPAAPLTSRCTAERASRRDFAMRRAVQIRTVVAVALLCINAIDVSSTSARDNGRFAGADPEIKAWFDKLASGRGPCCSDADGYALSDPDWESKGGHYRVRIDGQWIEVPDDAVITVPNRVGRTMVWPIRYPGQVIFIRCFMPGAMI
jgi:hypothetical protein